MAVFQCKSVLVPSDFSEQAHNAVDVGLELAGDSQHLTVIHVAPSLSNFSMGDPAVAWQDVSDESRQEELVQRFRDRFGDSKYQGVTFKIAFGSPAEEITRYAQDHNTDVIILPSHGRVGIARLMIGSVAERVVRLAHCPVLVLRD